MRPCGAGGGEAAGSHRAGVVSSPGQSRACLTPALLAVHWELGSEPRVCTNAETKSGEAPSRPGSSQAQLPGAPFPHVGAWLWGVYSHLWLLHLVLALPPSGEDRSTQVFRGSGRASALASGSSPPSAAHTRTHMCTYTATATHMHICMHVHNHAQAHTQAHTGPHTCTHVHRYTLVSAHSCTNTLMCICTAQSPARGHVHTHARTCTPREQATLQCTAGGPVPADCDVQGRTELRCLRPRSWGGLSCPWVPAWVGASRGNCLPRARGEAEGVWAGGQAGGSGMQLVTSRSWAGRAARGPSTQKMPPRQPASPGPLNANEE